MANSPLIQSVYCSSVLIPTSGSACAENVALGRQNALQPLQPLPPSHAIKNSCAMSLIDAIGVTPAGHLSSKRSPGNAHIQRRHARARGHLDAIAHCPSRLCSWRHEEQAEMRVDGEYPPTDGFLGADFATGSTASAPLPSRRARGGCPVPGSPFRGSDEPRQEIESHRAVERLCAQPTSISGPNLQQVFGPQVFRSRVFRSQVFRSQVFWSQVFGSRIFMSKSLGNEAQQGLDAARARKNLVRQGRSRQAQLFIEDALEDRAQIGRGLEIP